MIYVSKLVKMTFFLAWLRANSPERAGRFPGWHLIGGALILFIVVGVFTGKNIQETENSVSRLLAERGNALLEVFESTLRSSMRFRSGVDLQVVLEELAAREDIIFVALTTPSGDIIAHTDSSRVGKRLTMGNAPITAEQMEQLNMGPEADWALLRMEGKRVFLVHRTLSNISSHMYSDRISDAERKRKTNIAKYLPMAPDLPLAMIPGMNPNILPQPEPVPVLAFVGQDPAPIEAMWAQNFRSALLSGSLILLTGLTALLALHYFDRGRESRRRMRVAENLAQKMVGEVQRLELEMRRREKLAAVGDLAAGVAHELRNPLSSIKGYATYFAQRFPKNSEEREAAQIMVQETERLNRVITDLIGVSRPTDIHPVLTDADALIDSTLHLLSQDASQRGISMHREGSAGLVPLDPDRLRQAILNICLNAVEAMDKGGELIVRMHRKQHSVVMDFIDTGPGIPECLRTRIFDPYFTTKSQGTGLGLATTLKIVEAHKGALEVHALGKKADYFMEHSENPEPSGTRFSIILPLDCSLNTDSSTPASQSTASQSVSSQASSSSTVSAA